MTALLETFGTVDSEEEKPWTLLASEFTCVFPPGMEPSHSLVREVRVFDPNYVPLWLRKTYKDPQGVEVTFGYHVIGRWTPLADEESRTPVNLTRPSRKDVMFPFEGGVVYDQRTIADEWAQGSEQHRLACPDVFVPFDQRLVRWMEAAHRRLMRETGGIKQKELDRIDRQAAAETKALENVQNDARLSLRDDRRMIRRAIDEGRLSEDPAPDPKPFVQAEKVFEGAP